VSHTPSVARTTNGLTLFALPSWTPAHPVSEHTHSATDKTSRANGVSTHVWLLFSIALRVDVE
jgi:hypothetical protein